MITNMLMKFGVVAIAAFGAFAFNGEKQADPVFKLSGTCENITAQCDLSGMETCTIQVNGENLPVLDTDCITIIKHVNSNPVNWDYE